MNDNQGWQGYEQRGEAERNKRITMDEARKMMSEVLQDESERNLRDWFAGMATDEDVKKQLQGTVGYNRAWARYKHADAMLEARTK